MNGFSIEEWVQSLNPNIETLIVNETDAGACASILANYAAQQVALSPKFSIATTAGDILRDNPDVMNAINANKTPFPKDSRYNVCQVAAASIAGTSVALLPVRIPKIPVLV